MKPHVTLLLLTILSRWIIPHSLNQVFPLSAVPMALEIHLLCFPLYITLSYVYSCARADTRARRSQVHTCPKTNSHQPTICRCRPSGAGHWRTHWRCCCSMGGRLSTPSHAPSCSFQSPNHLCSAASRCLSNTSHVSWGAGAPPSGPPARPPGRWMGLLSFRGTVGLTAVALVAHLTAVGTLVGLTADAALRAVGFAVGVVWLSRASNFRSAPGEERSALIFGRRTNVSTSCVRQRPKDCKQYESFAPRVVELKEPRKDRASLVASVPHPVSLRPPSSPRRSQRVRWRLLRLFGSELKRLREILFDIIPQEVAKKMVSPPLAPAQPIRATLVMDRAGIRLCRPGPAVGRNGRLGGRREKRRRERMRESGKMIGQLARGLRRGGGSSGRQSSGGWR